MPTATTSLKYMNMIQHEPQLQPEQQQTGVAAGGQSEILLRIFNDPRLRYLDLDSQYWLNYYVGVAGYLPRPTRFAYVVPAATPANTTFLVANGKVIKNWNLASASEVTVSPSPPNLLNPDHSLALFGNLSLSGATTEVSANIMIIPPLTPNNKLPETFDINDVIKLWADNGVNLLAADATAAVTVPVSDLDPTGLKCRDIALVIKVVSAPAADTTIALDITGKKVFHKFEP